MEKVTPQELAAQLHNNQYGNEISTDQISAAKESGLVVIFGYSDDIMEIRGASDDEVYSDVYFTKSGLLTNQCDDDCPHWERLKEGAALVEMMWDDGSGYSYSWTYETEIPHAAFDILEGDEKYCRGIVFALSDVPAPNVA